MSQRLDETETVIALTEDYCRAMLNADASELKRVFHPGASIIGNVGDDLEFDDLEAFIASTPEARTGDGPFDYRIENIAFIGDTASVTVGNYSYGAWITDHLSLVKTEGTWRIVAKTFFVHPDE